jgi:hypothetical protein
MKDLFEKEVDFINRDLRFSSPINDQSNQSLRVLVSDPLMSRHLKSSSILQNTEKNMIQQLPGKKSKRYDG